MKDKENFNCLDGEGMTKLISDLLSPLISHDPNTALRCLFAVSLSILQLRFSKEGRRKVLDFYYYDMIENLDLEGFDENGK